jgi:hypothetical protein
MIKKGKIVLIDFGRSSFSVMDTVYASSEFQNTSMKHETFGFDFFRFIISFSPHIMKLNDPKLNKWTETYLSEITETENVLDFIKEKKSMITLQYLIEKAQKKTNYKDYEYVKKSLLNLIEG